MVNSIEIKTPETTGEAPDEHNQKMIDKANGITPPEEDSELPQGDRPAWLPEKFKTAEDMAKAYSALEGKLGGQAGDTQPAEPTPPVEEVDKALAQGGLSLDEFSNEFNTTGALSEESYQKLLAAGYDKSLVDNYISGQVAKASLHEADLKGIAGGSQAYDKMVDWAKATMTPSEIDAYNLSVSSTNVDAAKLAISGLKARYESANGREPKLVSSTNGASSSDKFESRNEITAAMKDPRYAKDPAYRAKVIDKLSRSSM